MIYFGASGSGGHRGGEAPHPKRQPAGRALAGVTMDSNRALKSKLGFADAQRFSAAMLDAAMRVASTSVGDDCGEGFNDPSAWEEMFARLDRR
jgi:hypothetical protein